MTTIISTADITAKQIQQIQTILSKEKLDRQERLQFLTDQLNREITTTKELTFIEAEDLIYFLNTGKKTTSNWAFFDDSLGYKSERKYLWSLLHQAQWVVKNDRHTEVPDLTRLSNFLKSPKNPTKKPLKKFNKKDWEIIIAIFLKIAKGTYK